MQTNIDQLSQILSTLQEMAARQTDAEWKLHGNRELNIAIQNTKKLIREAEELIMFNDDFECGASLGLHNIE